MSNWQKNAQKFLLLCFDIERWGWDGKRERRAIWAATALFWMFLPVWPLPLPLSLFGWLIVGSEMNCYDVRTLGFVWCSIYRTKLTLFPVWTTVGWSARRIGQQRCTGKCFHFHGLVAASSGGPAGQL